MDKLTAVHTVRGFAVLSFIGALASLVFGVLVLGPLMSGPLQDSPLIGVSLIVLALIEAIIGWGLWHRKEWSRIMLIVFASIGAAFGLYSIIYTLVAALPDWPLVILVDIGALVVAGIELWLFWYVKEIKTLFT